MDQVTRAEFARRCGVTRQSIDKALKSRKLRLVGEGRTAKIDLHDSLADKYMRDNSSNRQVAKQERVNGEGSENETLNYPIQNDEAGESVKLRDDKIKLQTKKLEIEMAEKLGQLIEKEVVEKMFNSISSSVVSYLLPLSDRLGPIMAGVFESSDPEKAREAKVAIDEEVTRALEGVKAAVNDALLVM